MIQEGTGHIFEKVVRVDKSPMNPKVKVAQLACGHDIYIRPPHRAPRIGATRRCNDCEYAAARSAAPAPRET